MGQLTEQKSNGKLVEVEEGMSMAMNINWGMPWKLAIL